MSAACHSRHVRCATQQTCLLCDKADRLLRHAAGMSAVSHGRRVCCVKLEEGEFGCGGKRRVSDKATNEKVPYIYIWPCAI